MGNPAINFMIAGLFQKKGSKEGKGMKTGKKTLSMILALALLIQMLPVPAKAEEGSAGNAAMPENTSANYALPTE